MILRSYADSPETLEACFGVLGIQHICHAILILEIKDIINFTSRDIGYCFQYFGYSQGY